MIRLFYATLLICLALSSTSCGGWLDSRREPARYESRHYPRHEERREERHEERREERHYEQERAEHGDTRGYEDRHHEHREEGPP